MRSHWLLKNHMTIIKEPVSRQKFQNEHHTKSMTSKVYLWCNTNYNHYINQSQHADFLHLFDGWQCSRHIKGYTPSLQSCSVRDAATSVPDYPAENKTMIKFMILKRGDTIQTITNRSVCCSLSLLVGKHQHIAKLKQRRLLLKYCTWKDNRD